MIPSLVSMSNFFLNNRLFIADSLRSFDSGFTAFKLGNKKSLTEKENIDAKENKLLKISCFLFCTNWPLSYQMKQTLTISVIPLGKPIFGTGLFRLRL